ncbi:MAG: shikimate kinase [Candidatus Hinthialibacter antarcticus]|nr:shikimate kinase [Candidatus Hinthialibacter antarcticus]
MNLVLIGYRGTGKSVLSNQVADKLGWPVFHMDEMLVERFGRPIPEFVEANGWDAFRDEEQKLTEELANKDQCVIDCGGGVIVRDANIEALRQSGFVVWLQAPVEVIAERIMGDANRPSLTGKGTAADEVRDVLSQREALYQKASHATIDTNSCSIEQCVEMIFEKFHDATTQS